MKQITEIRYTESMNSVACHHFKINENGVTRIEKVKESDSFLVYFEDEIVEIKNVFYTRYPLAQNSIPSLGLTEIPREINRDEQIRVIEQMKHFFRFAITCIEEEDGMDFISIPVGTGSNPQSLNYYIRVLGTLK